MNESEIKNQKINKVLPYLLLFLLVLSFFFVVKTVSELKEYRLIGSDIYPTSVITVSGEGEVFAIPDTATFTFSINEEADSSSEVQEKVTIKMNSILEVLKDSDIDEKDIKTIGYNLYPRYEYRRSGGNEIYSPSNERVLVGYELSHTISVKVRESDRAGEVVGKIGQMNVSNISSINFISEDEDLLLVEARKLAIDDARKKAKKLSKDLGVRLGRLVEFSDTVSQPPFYFAREESLMKDLDGASVPELPIGENRIVSQVYLVFEIR